MAKAKEVKFKCKDKPYLYVGVVDAQFKNGKYKTTNEDVIKYLRSVDNVEEL